MAFKIDYPPLLGPGFHHFSLVTLRRLCVDRFSDSESRRELFTLLEILVHDLTNYSIVCDVWVDGSIVTEKDEPSDLDVIVRMDNDVSQILTDQQRIFIDSVTGGRYKEKVDSFVFVSYPRGHTNFGTDLDERDGWARHYGIERNAHWCKGVAVIRVGETDVGLRIHP